MADKWIQLMSEDGTDNLFPTSKMDLLWANASPSSNFAAQTVSLDLSRYAKVIVNYRWATSDTSQYLGRTNIIGRSTIDDCCNPTNTATQGVRTYTSSTTGISFLDAYTGSKSNNIMIPLEIYGIK